MANFQAHLRDDSQGTWASLLKVGDIHVNYNNVKVIFCLVNVWESLKLRIFTIWEILKWLKDLRMPNRVNFLIYQCY